MMGGDNFFDIEKQRIGTDEQAIDQGKRLITDIRWESVFDLLAPQEIHESKMKR